jgi:hypothetical protein
MEVRRLQILDCPRRVQEIATGSFRKKAESSKHREPAMDSFTSPFQVIDNQALSPD